MILRRLLIRLGLFTFILFLLIFLFRNMLLQWSFRHAQQHIYRHYGLRLSAADLQVSGFDCVHIKNLALQPDGADRLLHIGELDCNISITDIITAEIAFDAIRANRVELSIYNETGRNNLMFNAGALNSKSKPADPTSVNFRQQALHFKTQLFRVLRTAFSLKEIRIRYSDSTLSESIYLPYADYDRKTFYALLINRKSEDSIMLKGAVMKKNESYELVMQHLGKRKGSLPFFDREHGLQCRFRSIASTFTFENSSDELRVSTDIDAIDLTLNHWRIATEDVVLPHIRFKNIWRIRDKVVQLDSGSVFMLGQVPVRMYGSYEVKPSETLSLGIYMPETLSDTFFHALPQGMFSTLKGISCTGTLAYEMQFFINTQQPDSIVFNSALTRKNFRLNHYGLENYSRINSPFTYSAYDKDRFVREIIVGEENPMFTPISKVSHYLTKAVLQSEDPSFMHHRGFLPEAFRESIIKNYKEKRFARGGSTISMQLVKNVFLSRDKTISRKLEEALIVYLIENLGLVSKERMLEVYLNVIEWGPNVYGIGEAARFYFNKKPSELTLQESIFLACLIPSPKNFPYRFTKEGNLKPTLEGYFRVITNRMAGKGWLTTADTTGLTPAVKLKGPAKNLIIRSDTIEVVEFENF